MNKRQKKKLYKKLHGYNPPKTADVQEKVQPKQKLEWKPPWGYVQENKDFAKQMQEVRLAAGKLSTKFTDCAVRIAKRAADAMAAFHIVPDMINAAREAQEKWAEHEKYKGMLRGAELQILKGAELQLLKETEPPVVKTAKILTVQRLSGKRNKNHTRNRRKRKWH